MDLYTFAQRLANLSPAKRALLEAGLKSQHLGSWSNQTIPRRESRGPAPLSFAQQRLWFLDQFEPNSTLYGVYTARRLVGALHMGALQKALDTIVMRHEVLRTTFVSLNGTPVQVISDGGKVELPIVDCSASSEKEVEYLIRDETGRPFNLSCDPMLRAKLFRVRPEDHVLLLSMHHIASDGWSMGNLFSELSVLYDALVHGRPSPLPDLPIQYADYAVWQREWLQGEILESQLSYWKTKLDGVSILQLPTDRRRPAIQTYRGAAKRFLIPTALYAMIKTVARRCGATMYMTLLAAFQVLLYRYSGQNDIVVGCPIAGRNRQELEGLIGFFVNTLVLRTDLSNNPTFTELLRRVREVALEAYAHQDLPFEKLVQELHPERNLSQSPLFQVVFLLHNTPNKESKFEGLTVTHVQVDSETAKFDLTLAMREEAQGLTGSLRYNTDLFDAGTIMGMADHFCTLLGAIADNPEQRISQLPLLSGSERHRLVVEWNDTETDYPTAKCIHELFETQAERTPDAIALVRNEQQLTYRELNSRSNQLAHCLKKYGVGPGTLVGVCIERSPEMIVALLGILKAGGAYLPLDAAYPKDRLRFMLADAQVPLVLTQEKFLEKIQHPVMVCMDHDSGEISRHSDENPRSETAPEDLAYVMYTSGSTGQPKGVEVTHRGVLRLVFGTDYARFDPAQTFLHLAPLSFDASTFEIWGALLHGARCVLFPGTLPTPSELGPLLDKHKINTLWLTASLFNAVIDEAPQALSGISQLLIGGEALSVSHVRRALELLPHTKIINGYGPTESTTFTCCYPIPRQLDDSLTSISIGRPIANAQVYLLDSNLAPVPVGVTGELHIGGDGLARGYLNCPELTAEKFMPNPFGREPGTRLYRTGDLARYLSDGSIEFLGRIDHQVKIRGFRIELGEIETVLRQHHAIAQAVAAVAEDSRGDKSLVAYVVLNRELASTTSVLHDFLKQKLPDYMVPNTFVLLPSLPLTPNGKVNRSALPTPDQSRPDLKESFVPPQAPVEKIVAAIWKQVLGLEKIGIHDNFFELGGHSLLATQVVSRLRDVFHLDLPIRALFEKPTVGELAESIRETQWLTLKPTDLVDILAELESMSDEQAQESLAKGS